MSKPEEKWFQLLRNIGQPVFYECDICGHCHPWEFNGDCRDDANRFTCEQLDAKFGPTGYDLRTMSERVEQDQRS